MMNGPEQKVLVVGAAGKFAGLVVPAVAGRGVAVRGLVRDEGQAATARKNGAVETMVGDLRDVAGLDEAMRDVDAVFHIGPAFVADESQLGLNVVSAARRRGVKKVVFSGVSHPSDRLENHASKRPVEDALFRSGLEFVILQPATLFQNIGLAWPGVLAHGVFAEPFSSSARIARVDFRDVAEVAAIALTEARLTYGTFELCSGEILDRHDVVSVMTEVLGRPVQAGEMSFDDFAAVAGAQLDARQLALFAEVFRANDEHGVAGNGLVLEAILGRAARTLRDYLRDLAAGEQTQV
jgi:uncharacterized protein YbjT (DUF2867 family)